MWIKNIEIKNVASLGFDNRKYEGCHALVKRVTIELDVVMLPVHEEHSDPMDRVKETMDHQVWYLRDPILKAVYQKELGKGGGPPLPNEEIRD